MIKKWRRIYQLFRDLLLGSASQEQDVEIKLRIALLNIVAIIGIATLTVFGTNTIVNGNSLTGLFDTITAVVLIFLMTYLRKRGYTDFIAVIGFSTVGALLLYLYLIGGTDRAGHLWFYCFPLIAVFLLGSRRGAVAVSMLIIPTILLSAVGSMLSIGVPHSAAFTVQFVVSFLFVFGIAYFFERLRERIQNELAERNAQLEKAVADLTETQEALEQSREQYQNIVEGSFDGIFMQKGLVIIFANRRLHRMLGYGEDELVGRKHWVVYHPDYQELTRERALARLRGEKVVSQYEVKLQRKDGSWFYGEIRARPITFTDGEGGIQVWARDITEQKLAEETLRASEEKYRTILASIEDGYYEVDLAGNLTFFNDALREILGYPGEKLMGMNNREFTDSENARKVYETFNSVYRTGLPAKGVNWKLIRKDGAARYVDTSVSIVRDPEGRPVGFRGIARDITERRLSQEKRDRLEAQLRQAQKMESIGTLAGGIAHDFNNLLMGIQGRASLMLMNKEPSHPDFEHLKGIEAQVDSAAGLTQQLLGFARGGKYEVRATDLNELIERESRMFGRTRKEIVIKGVYEEDLWTVEVDRVQIEQVLLNLFVNASQAMPGGGTLYLETANVRIDEDYGAPFSVTPGRYVKISVTDTGVGMDSSTLKRIFEPFFTTKEMGRGTGLGLASAYGIVKNHGGFINVYSEKGRGSTFNIYLPASPDRAPEDEMPTEELLTGSETILLVDDEEMIVEVAAQILERLGYNVLTAASGREALEIYGKNPGAIALVILDMIMPDMGGGQTYERLKDLDPGVRVLLSSGYSMNGQATEILDRGCNGFIQKPFKINELSQKLWEIIHGRKPSL